MYYVYILKDLNNRLYIGYSSNLKKRIKEHLSKKVFTTKKMNEPSLLYYEAYISEDLAREREKKIKQFGSSYMGLVKRLGLK
ncbi:MAG TPA: GIY-YIG nuclease family protein [Candidatus Nitrosocosmicus sp.]|nr:GIY-YIG nuclease family protein [Candidatus Nitrosocosmicus sp.]